MAPGPVFINSENTHPLIPLILYEDDHLIAVNKPSGMLAQDDSTGRASLAGLVTSYLEKGSSGGPLFCAALHRLDRPVSGVMLFAKTGQAASVLSSDIRQRRVQKFYCALVNPAPDAKCTDVWMELRQHYVRRRDRAYIVGGDTPGAAEVALKYRVAQTDGMAALLLLELITGRRHQIRVQLSSIGMPINGDRFYGSKEFTDDGIICLHAHHLCFNHPVTGGRMTVSAPLPPHMNGIAVTSQEIGDYLKGLRFT